uniref:LP11739p n=1 Tax=Drosophila melanogaster TaxID=7227 RepID=Q8MST2_DROME|nr:LP11739p [Drosophila melanogaster]
MFGQKGAHVTPPENQMNERMNEEMNELAAIFKIER